MKVVHCIHSTGGGGAETQLRLLHQAFGDVGVDSMVLCLDDSANLSAAFPGRLRVIRANGAPGIAVMKAFRSAMIEFRPDLTHVWLPPAVTVPTMLAAATLRLPIVFSYRNRMWFRDWKRALEFFVALGVADGIASNAPAAQNATAHRWLFARKQGVVVPNAIALDPSLWHSLSGRAGSELRLMFAGRLTGQKNWRTLIRALTDILDLDGWSLDMFGEGEDRASLERMIAECGLSSHVRLRGYSVDLAEDMRNADLLVCPSWYEGSPNVLAEAVFLGLPAVVSDIPAHRELLGPQGAGFFSPGEAVALAGLLRRALCEPSLVQTLAREQASVTFVSPQQSARQYADYYANVLGRRGSEPLRA